MVIPTLGRRIRFLREALHSISSQDVRADVVIVTPTDASDCRELAEQAGASVVDDPGGMTAAINAGWRAAMPHHDYVAWLGDDDVLTPGSLRTAVDALDADDQAVAAFGYCEYIADDGSPIWLSRAGRFAPWLMTWGPDLVPQPGSLFRRSAIDRIGALDEGLRFAMDLDVLIRLRRIGRFVNTRRVQAKFRWHPESNTVADRSGSLDESEMVKRRYYTPLQFRLKALWERPVRVATRLAARRLNARLRRLGSSRR